MTTVLIVDDHPIVRLSLKMLLERERFQVVGEVGDGSEVTQEVRRLRPNVVILDIGLPDIGGYEAYTISIRPVEDVDGEWRLIATDINSVLWNEEWSEMAFNSDETVIWQTFPEAEQIGQWETGPFWSSPVAWSPDGRSLVRVGNNPGLWEYGLFILER